MFNPFRCNVGNCIYFCPLWTHISPIWAMKPIICPYQTHMGPFHYRTIGIFITLAHIRPTSVPYGWGDIVPPILDTYLSHMGNKKPESTHMLPIWEMSAHMRQIITTWVPFLVVWRAVAFPPPSFRNEHTRYLKSESSETNVLSTDDCQCLSQIRYSSAHAPLRSVGRFRPL